jgi:hypothetical protein
MYNFVGQIVTSMPQAISALGALLEIPQALFVMMNLIHSNSNVFEFLVNTGNAQVLLQSLIYRSWRVSVTIND